MKTQAYSIYDRKALVYHLPFYALNDAVAVRTLSDVVADPQSMFSRHPNDYVLYQVGEFDDGNGTLTPTVPAVHVIDAATLVKSLQSEIPFPDRATTTEPRATEEQLSEEQMTSLLRKHNERVRANGGRG